MTNRYDLFFEMILTLYEQGGILHQFFSLHFVKKACKVFYKIKRNFQSSQQTCRHIFNQIIAFIT